MNKDQNSVPLDPSSPLPTLSAGTYQPYTSGSETPDAEVAAAVERILEQIRAGARHAGRG